MRRNKIRLENAPKDCIRTNSGIYINVFETTEEMLSIEDIAHALSHQCRFAGHLTRFYSVAQHSINCARKASNPENKLAALLHDATEAYLLDIPTPIKAKLPGYKRLEHKLSKVIAKKFNFIYPYHDEIKEIDGKMLHIEWDNLVANDNPEFVCLSSSKAKKAFIKEYYSIIKELKSVLV